MHTMIGEIDEARLTKKQFDTGSDEWSTCKATEWYLGDEMVRRDVDVTVHKLPTSELITEI